MDENLVQCVFTQALCGNYGKCMIITNWCPYVVLQKVLAPLCLIHLCKLSTTVQIFLFNILICFNLYSSFLKSNFLIVLHM